MFFQGTAENLAHYFRNMASYEAWQNRGYIYNWKQRRDDYIYGVYSPVKINPSAPGYEHRFVWPK